MRIGIMVAGGVIIVIGVMLMVVPVFIGVTTPFGEVGTYAYPYVQWGMYLLILGIVVLIIGAVVPSPKLIEPMPKSVPKPEETKIRTVAICPNCKARISPESKFCSECGTDLTPKKR